MKKTVRDAVVDTSMELCRCVDRVTSQAKEHALRAIDGDEKELILAREYRAMAVAYEQAMKRVDELRFAIERGDFL